MRALAPTALALALALGPAARAQPAPPSEAAREPRWWRDAAARLVETDAGGRLTRAALLAEAGALLAAPEAAAARQAALPPGDDPARGDPAADAVLRRLAAAPLAPPLDGAGAAALLAAPPPTEPLDAAARTLALLRAVDAAADPAAALAALRAAAPGDADVAALTSAPAVLAALGALDEALRDLGVDGPPAPLPEAPPRGFPRSCADLLDLGREALARPAGPGPRGGPGASAGLARAHARAAWAALHLERPWLAHALLARQADPAAATAGVGVEVAEAALHLASLDWGEGSSLASFRAALAPVARRGGRTWGPYAAALLAALDRLEADAAAFAPPTAAAWEALGLDDRLRALVAAARAGLLDARIPTDAPTARGEPATARERLAALGWHAIPALLGLLDDPRPTRRVLLASHGPALVEPLGRAAADLLELYVEDDLRARVPGGRALAEAWWAAWRERGPARFWARRLRGADDPAVFEAFRARAEADIGATVDAMLRERVAAAATPDARAMWLAALVEPPARAAASLDLLRAAAADDDLAAAGVGVRGLVAAADPGAAEAAARLAARAASAPRGERAAALPGLLAAGHPGAADALAALPELLPGLAAGLAWSLPTDGPDGRLALLHVLLAGDATATAAAQAEARLAALREAAGPPLDLSGRPRRAQRLATAAVAEAWPGPAPRRDLALAVALLLGEREAARLEADARLPLRAALADALLDPARCAAAAAAARRAGHWTRPWLARLDHPRAAEALAALDAALGPPPDRDPPR